VLLLLLLLIVAARVTNQAIQVLQGPYITNTYGGGIQCQGPTLNITPFVTGAGSMQKPYEPYYNDPVYDMRDLNDDGSLDNPGGILYLFLPEQGRKITIICPWASVPPGASHKTRNYKTSVRKRQQLKLPYSSN
jgi:hypothetical protein